MQATDPTIALSDTRDIPQAAPRSIRLWVWTLLGSILFGATGHMLIKWGVVHLTRHAAGQPIHLVSRASLPLLFGLSIYLMGTVLWMVTVSRKEISYLYPLTSLTYLIVVAGGAVVFHESISMLHWLGLTVIVAGVALMQVSSRVD